VLDDVNVEILPGTVVGIFGKTGSGKTTLLRLMARLFDPPAGTLFVDEADICSVDRAAWRKRMAVAPQRPFLFSETIEDNITLGMEPGAESLEVATSAATSAALDSDLRVLPHGMQTVVGQRGIMLSGGQRQRVALARALVRNADLVLLDDVLSAVDHQTEAALVESLRDAGKGRQVPPTVVIVSNRVSALRHADNIVVLDEGRVSDQGTHDELVSRPGVYQQIWEVQRS
jgi:ATP-binding cassette subfamily B multidrug efflux pump